MQIIVNVKDRDGNDINIGDVVELYDWGGEKKSIGRAEVVWDNVEGRISTLPVIVEDPYDFWTKALPSSKKVIETKENDHE